jgi:hypothetical protein
MACAVCAPYPVLAQGLFEFQRIALDSLRFFSGLLGLRLLDIAESFRRLT